ncbi:hypothetical protein PtB15_5B718 [Puccinia triticina]|nr:hypothetical protein PtB15_5B718 [Puccinia triticina]
MPFQPPASCTVLEFFPSTSVLPGSEQPPGNLLRTTARLPPPPSFQQQAIERLVIYQTHFAL